MKAIKYKFICFSMMFPTLLFAQLFESPIVLSPYEKPAVSSGRTMGGASVAVADSVPAVACKKDPVSPENPSGFAFYLLHDEDITYDQVYERSCSIITPTACFSIKRMWD
ncbi:hypothetical protein JW935_15925 [candidate division KSB1 bacterium]|nr:hypothetical protein [candidate division KSB1 bacterium]